MNTTVAASAAAGGGVGGGGVGGLGKGGGGEGGGCGGGGLHRAWQQQQQEHVSVWPGANRIMRAAHDIKKDYALEGGLRNRQGAGPGAHPASYHAQHVQSA